MNEFASSAVRRGGWPKGAVGPDWRFLPLATLLVVLIAVAFMAPLVHAASLDVDTTVDTNDAVPGDGTCADGSGNCSLRAAIQEANALGGSDTISLTLPGPYALTLGQLDVTSEIVVYGNGATISAGGASRVFYVSGAGNLSLKDLTVRDGLAAGNAGGGILIDSGGTLNVLNCAILDNAADFNGGGISNFLGTLNVANSTISGNSAGGNGGGIHQLGFFGNGRGTVTHVTITDNTADSDDSGGGDGGGIYTISSADTFKLKNSIVAGNQVGATGTYTEPDCYHAGGFVSLGNNLVGITEILPPGVPNGNDDLVGTNASPLDPQLVGLVGNPPYHPSQPTSLILDQVEAVSTTFTSFGVNPLFADGAPITSDQVGNSRLSGAASDIGAFESGPTGVDLVSFAATPTRNVLREWMATIDELGSDLISFVLGSAFVTSTRGRR